MKINNNISELIAQGENSSIEFKSEKVRPESLAREMTAFANTNGGVILIKEELSRLFQQAGLVHYDIAPVEGTNEKDLDEIKLHDYWMSYYEINFSSLEDQDRKKLLINADILVPHEDSFCASVGGLLIFGRNPQQRLPHSSVKMAVFKGTHITDDLIDKKK